MPEGEGRIIAKRSIVCATLAALLATVLSRPALAEEQLAASVTFSVTQLFAFAGGPESGGLTTTLILAPDGNFYGTTFAGGMSGVELAREIELDMGSAAA